MTKEIEPVVLTDEYGEVHFHLVPFADPSIVKHLHDDETISNHQDAMKKVMDGIREKMTDRCASCIRWTCICHTTRGK